MVSSGLEIARAFIGRTPRAIGEALRFRLLSVEDGFAVCGGTVGPHALNPMGFAHGGYISTLLDTACGFAVLSRLASGEAYTTIDLQVAFHRGVRADVGEVRAEGRVVSSGRRIAFAKAELLDAEGRLYASATSSLIVIRAEA